MNHIQCSKVWLFCGQLLFPYILLSSVCFSVEGKEQKGNTYANVSIFKKTEIGKDVNEFAHYSDMMNTAPLKSFDVRADLLINFINARMMTGCSAEDSDVWEALIGLTPYRKNTEVLDALSKWAFMQIQRSVQPKTNRRTDSFFGSISTYFRGTMVSLWTFLCDFWLTHVRGVSMETASEAYSEKKYDKSEDIYTAILRNQPQNLDARNNLALVCLHQCNDPAALLELQIAILLKKDYLPGLINLTLVYERLDLPEKAHQTANQALSIQPLVPAVAVNAAWFERVLGNHRQAKRVLNPILKIDSSNAKALNLYKGQPINNVN